jgi:acetoin utilization deacetylase AcuC-like enzyme
MGFCLFNNVAVAAYHALNHHGLKRVAIVDFDVHHGNGTETIVKGDQRILFCSSFQHPFYPHSGHDTEAPNILNLPLPAGCDGSTYRAAVTREWLPKLQAFAPELVLVSAGFDAHQADPLADFMLVEADFAWITQQLCEQAEHSAGGRLVSLLEGGYDLHALARCVEAHLKAMLEGNGGALDRP